MCLHGPHLFQIEGAGDLAKLSFRPLWDTLRLQQALAGCLWRMVAPLET